MSFSKLRATVLFAIILTVNIAVLISIAFSGSKPAVYRDASDLALNGYDAVAYFSKSTPVKGDGEFSYRWMDATWLFSNEQNLNLFKKQPEAYAPKYGGYCAYAVGNNYTYPGDPLYWRIVGGKLYLNANADAQQLWSKDVPGYIKKGDKNWPAVLNK